MPKVSIIVPFINGEKYLKDCLNCLLNINYDDYEIVLIDDSSIDDSKKIIEQYLKNKKIRYYYLEDNTIGVGRARNYGIEKSNGKYIMFVDVDDYIDKNLILRLEKYMKEDIDLIKYKMEILEDKIKRKKQIDTDGPIFDKTSGEDAFNKLCFKDKYLDSPCIYLIKKEYIEKNNLKFPENMYHEDFGLIPILVAKSNTVVSTKERGYKYVQTSNSIMRNNNYGKTVSKMNNKIKHYINMTKEIERTNLSSETKENMKAYYTNSILLSLKNIKKEDKIIFKEKIRSLKLIDNLKARNIRQKTKKIAFRIWLKY